jgi:hypothetical protein
MPPPISKPTTSHPRGLLFFVLIIPVLVIASLIYWRVSLYFRVKHQLAAVRSAGLPASGAELNDWLPQIPDAQNGALALTQAFTNLHQLSDFLREKKSELTFPKRNESWSPEQSALAREYLATNRQALAQIESALHRYSEFKYPADYAYGAGTLLPHLRHVKVAAQNFRYQTILQSAVRDPTWTNSVLLQLKLANTLNGEPNVIGSLVRVAAVSIAARSAEYALNHSIPNPDACAALQSAFLRTAETNTLRTALIGERAIAIPYFRMSRADMEGLRNADGDSESESSSSPPIKPSGRGFGPLMFVGFFERDLSFYLDTMDRAIDASRLSPPDSLRLTNIFDVGPEVHRRFYIFSGMFLPALSKASIKVAQAEAVAKLAAASFAVESFRHAHNRFPADLAELVPEFMNAVPADPFDGQPVRYRQIPQGYLLYSVDVDGRDDKGTEPPASRKSKDAKSYDLTFTVER